MSQLHSPHPLLSVWKTSSLYGQPCRCDTSTLKRQAVHLMTLVQLLVYTKSQADPTHQKETGKLFFALFELCATSGLCGALQN